MREQESLSSHFVDLIFVSTLCRTTSCWGESEGGKEVSSAEGYSVLKVWPPGPGVSTFEGYSVLKVWPPGPGIKSFLSHLSPTPTEKNSCGSNRCWGGSLRGRKLPLSSAACCLKSVLLAPE